MTCVPLVPLEAAAGAFGRDTFTGDAGWQWNADDNEGWPWVEVDTPHRLRPGMFVARVVGHSMEPKILDGAYCLFAAPVEGTRNGKIVLVELLDSRDPETNQRYTVKRYRSQKSTTPDTWHHEKITLEPLNPDYQPLTFTANPEEKLKVIAELVEVLG